MFLGGSVESGGGYLSLSVIIDYFEGFLNGNDFECVGKFVGKDVENVSSNSHLSLGCVLGEIWVWK